jgi:hypothetical protein
VATFAGLATVTVTADDGSNQAVETFVLTVTNAAPVVTPVDDQTIGHNVDTLAITMSGTDGDSDTITYSAIAGTADATEALAYQLDQTHDFHAAVSEFQNLRGLDEKYFQNASDEWFYILSTGAVHQWSGTIAGSTLLGTLNSTYHDDLTTLFDVPEPLADNSVDVSLANK